MQDNCSFLQNRQNGKSSITENSAQSYSFLNEIDTPKCDNNVANKLDKSGCETISQSMQSVRKSASKAITSRNRKYFVYSIVVLMLSILVLTLSFTYAQLSATKIATGSITFTLESPAVTYNTPLNFKYENGTMTYGLTTDGGTPLASVPYNITIDSDNTLSSYYALVGFQFIDTSSNTEITSGITFGSSPSFGSTAMSVISYDTTYNAFVSKSSKAVTKGGTLNLMSYFSTMNLSNLPASNLKVNILLILDKNSNYNSVNRTQNTFVANIKTIIKTITVTKPSYYLCERNADIYVTTTQSEMDNCTKISASNGGSAPIKVGPFAIQISEGFYFKLVFNLGIKLFNKNTGNDINYDGWVSSGNIVSKTITVSNYNYLVEFILNSSDVTDLSVTCLTPFSSSTYSIAFYSVLDGISVPRTVTSGLWTNNSATQTCIPVLFFGADKAEYLTNSSLNDKTLLAEYSVEKESGFVYYTATYSAGCVVGDTKVSTGFNGEYKLAKDIVEGDEVLTFNMITFEWELCKIIGTSSHIVESTYKVELSNGEFIQLTSGHPIYTRRGWSVCDSYTYDHDMAIYPEILQEQDLQIGDKVKCGDEWVEIINISKIKEEVSVYGLTIAGNHNFLANGALVHNVASGS